MQVGYAVFTIVAKIEFRFAYHTVAVLHRYVRFWKKWYEALRFVKTVQPFPFINGNFCIFQRKIERNDARVALQARPFFFTSGMYVF